MKKHLLVLFIIVISLNGYAQIKFEKGYFVDNTDEKIECYIKNSDWINNPTAFEYRMTPFGETQKGDIESIKEFTIEGVSKYIRYTVNIDRGNQGSLTFSTERNPVFKEETLFLKVLIEGNADLYIYEEGSVKLFFYKANDNNASQLVYKIYKKGYKNEGHDYILNTNETFKQQLYLDLSCQNINQKDVENLNYNKKELIKFFIKYYECDKSGYVTYVQKKAKSSNININVRPGLTYNSLSVSSNIASKNFEFDNELGFRMGFEAEFVLPYNANKWAILIEPTFQSYQSEIKSKSFIGVTGTYTVTIDYSSIELPIGIRYYSFITDKSRLFINASCVFEKVMSDKLYTPERLDVLDLQINSTPNLAVGLGYIYDSKYSMEMRYGMSRNLLNDYINYSSNYSGLSFIIGYRIL